MEMKKNLTKANNELSSLKSRLENGEGGVGSAELEEVKKKYNNRIQELEAQLEETQSKCSSLEKIRTRLQGEVEDLSVDSERVSIFLHTLA